MTPSAGEMSTTTFGRTSMRTTRLGFGTGSTSHVHDGVRAALVAATDCGINWLDTAAVYGDGQAEEAVGAFLRERPSAERPYVFTKCNFGFDAHGRPEGIARPEFIKTQCEASLRRLGLEHVDLYQMHWPPSRDVPAEEYVGALGELKAEGKVRAIGLSNYPLAQLKEAYDVAQFDAIQSPFSLVTRELASEILPWCAARDVAVMTYSPMQSGLLTGGWTSERIASLPEDDWRLRTLPFREGIDATLAFSDALQPIADRLGISRGALAVAWVLAWPGVTGVVASATRPEQVADWVGASEVRLAPEVLGEIAALIDAAWPHSGPALPDSRITV